MVARISYDYELELLHLDIIKMSSLVENAIERAIEAFKNHNSQEASAVISADEAINSLEKQIESRCLTLILRQQPVASDLRTVSTALKMITDLERIGDNASDIAELSIRIKSDHGYTMAVHIPKMAGIACQMVHDAISAFVAQDLDAAKKVITRDDEVDELFNEVKTDLIEISKESNDNYDAAIDILMIAKYLEKIADHAVNICEWTEFLCTGIHNNVRVI